jgi:hypothetical protein
MWLLVGVLTVLLGLLAMLQYRWTGEIGRAEAERQQHRLERSAAADPATFGPTSWTVSRDGSRPGTPSW